MPRKNAKLAKRRSVRRKPVRAVRRVSRAARKPARRRTHLRVLAAVFLVLLLVSSLFIGYPRFSDLLPPGGKHFAIPLEVKTVSASSAGPSVSGAVSAGGSGWANVTTFFINTSDTNYTVYNFTDQSDLRVTAFGFSIPTSATINTITVNTTGYGASGNSNVRKWRIGLTKDGTTLAGTQLTAQQFTTSDSVITSGGDLWGTTWSPSEVNASTFGLLISDNDATATSLNFNYVTVTIAYTLPSDPSFATGSGGIKIYQSSSTTWDTGTTLTCTGIPTDDNTATVDCTSSNAVVASTSYRLQLLLKNAGETVLVMDGASEYVDIKNVKAGWAGTNPTLGACVFNDFGSDDTATTACTAAWNGNDVRITETGSGSISIAGNGATNQGFAFLITTDSAGLAKTNSTMYFDTSIDSLAEDSSKFTITGPNTAPDGTLNSAAQKTDGTGVVDISTTVSDADGDLSKAKVEYVSGAGCTGTWTKATLQTPITATYSDTGGVPDITNANAYQVGTTATTQIKTASGANTVDFDWASATDVASGNGTYCLRLTPNDFTTDDASPATRTLTIDNVAPTAPGNLTDGGKTSSTITLTFGAQTTETNFSQYKIYYKAGASGVTESDTQWTDSDLSFINYNGTANTVVTGLSANTAYVFNIWAYDSYGKKANATEVSITTSAAATVNFDMQTGYYVGTGADNFQITALGWSPDFVMIKDDNAGGTDGPIFKTSVMSGESAALFEAEADIGTDTIQSLDATGFTVGTYADVNAASTRFHWIAFDGSTCNSNGTFCVGSYTGDGAATKAITSVGFQPDLVIVKGAGATEAVWRSSAMATNAANFLTSATVEDTGGTYFTTLNATGFTVGNNAAVNTIGTTYWYVAFKQIATRMKVSSYTGNGTAGTSIIGVGFAPDFVFLKGANNTASQWGVYNVTESNEDYSSYFNDAANAKGLIQQLEADGFELGAGATVNESTKTYYYAAFGGAVDPTPSGTFTMASGSYIGTGIGFSVTGVGFSPDLVIIKSSGTVSVQATYFRHRLMSSTGAFVNLGYISDAINSFDSDGFTIGAAAGANASGEVYHWQAFGNAFDPLTNSGAADFAIGAYTGNVGDNRNILRLGFQPDLIVVKYSTGLLHGQFRTSSQVGDVTGFFTAIADGSNAIQAINSDGFQLGTSLNVSLGGLYYYFAFKAGTNFKVGTYTGNGTSQSISGLGFRPDLVWAKSSSAYNSVMRSDSMTASSTAYFASTANSDNQIWSIDTDGFTVGSQNETNGSTLTYWRMAWNNSSARWGTLYSASIDMDSYPSIYNKNAVRMVWNQNVPTGCLLQMYVRSTNTTGASPDYASSTWQGPYVGYTSIGRSNLAGNAFLQGKRYFQYRVDMYSCYLNNRLPTLYDVTLEFD